jgi:long-chain acyl-CoA synthetase
LGSSVEESRLAEIYTVRDLVNAVLESVGKGGKARAPFAGWRTVFEEPVTDRDVLDLAKRRRFAEVFWFSVSRLIRLIALEFFHFEYTGLEKLPKNGPYLLSSNHQSYIDPAVLAGVLPWSVFKRLFAVGTSEIFGSGLMRILARWVRVVVVDPDANLLPAMRAGAFGLGQGRVLMLYPEGERSIDGTPRIFKKGAAILSVHMQVPIVPIAIDGFYEAWPRGKKFFQKLTHLQMKIGDPIYPPSEVEASEEAYAKLTADVKARVVEMWEELHGKSEEPPETKAAD